MKKWFAVLAACTMTFASPPVGRSGRREDRRPLQPQAEAPAASLNLPPESVAAESGARARRRTRRAGGNIWHRCGGRKQEDERMKSLVVYFSGREHRIGGQRNPVPNRRRPVRAGPSDPYTDDYNALPTSRRRNSAGARPTISGSVDLSGYDVIYLGYPNWWGDMPMILYTFLDGYDLSGKTVAPCHQRRKRVLRDDRRHPVDGTGRQRRGGSPRQLRRGTPAPPWPNGWTARTGLKRHDKTLI
ncbi:MAG: flavodoxin [Anaerotruncus massiliensis (ex Togo et al. 2019)]